MLETVENVWNEFARKFVELWRTQAGGDLYPSLFPGEADAARREPSSRPIWRELFRARQDFRPQRSSVASWVWRQHRFRVDRGPEAAGGL